MMKTGKYRLAAVAGIVLLLLTGCASGGATAASSSKAVPTLSAKLPASVKSNGYLTAGVNCNYPPAGSVDLDGKHVGYEIDWVKRLAELAFGSASKVKFQCVTDANRIPFLTSGKVDFVLASLAWSAERAQQIDFTDPIWKSNMRLLVPKDSKVSTYKDLAGKTVITTQGTSYVNWLQKCHPDATLNLVPSQVDGTTALKQGRGDALAYIDVYLYNFTTTNKQYKVVAPIAASATQGIGVAKGNQEMLDWLNAAIAQMRHDDYFYKTFAKTITDKSFVEKYRPIVPGPKQKVEYPNANGVAGLAPCI
ncbi:MAG: transporter substrate-binding domain-containing protein [Pseudoclavibacter sp.]